MSEKTMGYKSELIACDTHAEELATVIHDGRAFTAGGFSIDVERGRMVAYVTERKGSYLDGPVARFILTTWSGDTLAELRQTGESWGFFRTRLTSFQTLQPIAGYYWYGRGLGAGMVLKLHRGRKS